MILLFTLILIIILSSGVYAKDGVTPYGVPCPMCREYGYCKRPLTYQEAARALESYYEKRGLRAVVTGHEGRFTKADIYRDGEVVDKVILDRRSGRMRSIY